MEYKEAEIPEAAKKVQEEKAEDQELDVTVMHLEEDEQGEVKEVVDMVADENKTATIETTETKEVEKAEFVTDSFSTFTLTWSSSSSYSSYSIDIKVVDSNGTEIGTDASYTISVATELSAIKNDIEGYTYSKATLNSADGTEVTRVKCEKSGRKYTWKYSSDGSTWNNLDSNQICFVYTRNLNIKVVDSNGTEIGTDTSYSISTTTELSTIKNDIEGYTYNKATLNSADGTEVKYVKYGRSGGTYTWMYSSDGSTWNNLDSNPIYFVYTRNPGLYITDDIVDSGALKAEYISDDESLTVTSVEWFRSNEKEGTYDKVDKVSYKVEGVEGDISNLSEDGMYLYPAYDNGAQKWYKVTVTLSDGTPKSAGPIQVAYYNELQNGSFEEPEGNTQWSNADYKNNEGVWQTTQGKIEIVNPNSNPKGWKDYSWKEDYWKNSPVDGEQFAELNGNDAGALYQDVLTMEGTSLNYWLSHRARGAYTSSGGYPDSEQFDTMFLVIMPTKVAKENNLTTQANLNSYLTSLGVEYGEYFQEVGSAKVYDDQTTGVMVLRVTSSNQAWQDITGMSGYTPISSLTRFFFMSGKTASGNDTVGNFLDKVGFSQSLPPVADDEFSLQIEKKFSGLTTEQITQVKGQISFEITAKKGDEELDEEQVIALFGKKTILGSEMTSQPDGSLVYHITNQKIGVKDEYEVTIKEKDADLDGYQLETTAKTQVTSDGGDSTTTDDSTIAQLKGKTTSVVTFTNTYKPAKSKTVNFTKVWDDGDNRFTTRPDSLDVTLQASIVVEENGVEVEKTLDVVPNPSGKEGDPPVTLIKTLNAVNDWNCSWDVPVYYDYYGTDIKINYSVKEGTINSDYEYSAVANTDGTALKGTGSKYKSTTDFSKVTTGESTTTSDTSTVNTSQSKAKSKSLTTSLFASSMLTNSASLLMSMDDLAVATAAEESSLDEPAHNKYITYNANTADYTLNLDVKGAKGDATGVDVLFVIDTSGSMGTGYNDLLPELKSLLTEDDGIVNQIFATDGNVNSVAFVSFAGKEETQTTSWYQTSGKDAFKQKIKALRATGGTNWTYAMMKASDVLSQRSSSSNEKVVIFLSDGEPTFTINSSGRQTGYGYRTESSYYTDAINKVKYSSVLSGAKMYSVYLTSDTKSGMKKFSDGTNSVLNKTYSDLVNGINLKTALSAILSKVIPTYKDVVITDTLSDYVNFVESNPTITVTKKSASGATTTLAESDYAADVSGKTVTVNLLNGNSLEDGATYTVSFRVKPSEKATSYYNEHGSYPDTGDAGTGTTSAGQAGFYSNNDKTTKLTYQIDGTTKPNTATYPKPVVQLTTHKLSYEKVWNKPDNVEIPEDAAVIDLLVTYTDGTTNTIQLTADNKYKYEETVSANKNIQTVSEQTTLDGYTPSYSITENGTKAVVTNSYTKITATSIKVVKTWEGDGPTSAVKVSLWQQSSKGGNATQYGETVTLDEDCDWQYLWEDLPQSEGNGSSTVTYTYAVQEESIPTNYTSSITYAYDSTQTVATITNTYDSNCADEDYYIANVLQTEQLTINKIWKDNGNEDELRPDDLVVNVDGMKFTLYPNGTDKWTSTVTVPKKENYSASEDLTGENGQYYEQEGDADVSDTSSGKSITFTNRLKTKSISVHKVWNDGDIESRPESIQFKLQYKKVESSDAFVDYDVDNEDGIYTLTEADKDTDTDGTSWTKVINNLPAIYEFDVVEVSDTTTKYLTDVSHSEDRNTFTITNTLKWSAKKVSESWNSKDKESKGLSGAEFELIQGENVLAIGTSSTAKGAKGEIKWDRTDYAKNNNINLDKLNGDYTIHETKAPSGYILSSKNWKVKFVNGLLTTLDNVEVKGTATDGVVIELTNKKVYDLPSTGGSGIYWYMIGGTLLMFAAVWILYKNECREVLKR